MEALSSPFLWVYLLCIIQ